MLLSPSEVRIRSPRSQELPVPGPPEVPVTLLRGFRCQSQKSRRVQPIYSLTGGKWRFSVDVRGISEIVKPRVSGGQRTLADVGGMWSSRTPKPLVGVTEPVEHATRPCKRYREDQRGGAPMRSEPRRQIPLGAP